MKRPTPRFRAKVKDGKLEYKSPEKFYAHLWGFRPGDDLVVTVDRDRPKRSSQQNRYYWGVVLKVISEVTGHTQEELHEVFKRMFLPRRIVKFKDKEYPLPGTTTETDSAEFTEFIERVRAEAGTLGISIPNPDQVDF